MSPEISTNDTIVSKMDTDDDKSSEGVGGNVALVLEARVLLISL